MLWPALQALCCGLRPRLYGGGLRPRLYAVACFAGFMRTPALQAFAVPCFAGFTRTLAPQALCRRLLRRLYADACVADSAVACVAGSSFPRHPIICTLNPKFEISSSLSFEKSPKNGNN
jgi:hypothetical protein